MDVLINKQRRTDFDSISRYLPFSYYYHTLDDKFVVGLTGHLETTAEYVAHSVKDTDTLESLALRYYGRPDFFWVIADFNRIKDPFLPLLKSFKVIKVPSLGQITFEERR
jgi:hypothetical protein